MRDTVNACLRSTIFPYTIFDSSKAVIDSISLAGSFTFRNTTSGTYYIVIKHRNSIETWSKPGGELVTNGVENSYDFTTSASQAMETIWSLQEMNIVFTAVTHIRME